MIQALHICDLEVDPFSEEEYSNEYYYRLANFQSGRTKIMSTYGRTDNQIVFLYDILFEPVNERESKSDSGLSRSALYSRY